MKPRISPSEDYGLVLCCHSMAKRLALLSLPFPPQIFIFILFFFKFPPLLFARKGFSGLKKAFYIRILSRSEWQQHK
jgi:hypothetical protein